jgi:hypothetical protein
MSWAGGQDVVSFHHTTQNGMLLKLDELFTSDVFHLVFLEQSSPWITEVVERRISDNGYY